jgi:hypothetical protein
MLSPPRYVRGGDAGQRPDSRPQSYFYASSYESVSRNGVTAVRRGVNDNGKVSRDGYVIDAQGKTHSVDYPQIPHANVRYMRDEPAPLPSARDNDDDDGGPPFRPPTTPTHPQVATQPREHVARSSSRGDAALAMSPVKPARPSSPRGSRIESEPFRKWPYFHRRPVASTRDAPFQSTAASDVARGTSQQKTPFDDVPEKRSKSRAFP